MCTIQPLTGSSDCLALNGGVKFAYAFPISELTAITVTSGSITGFTMASTGQFKKLSPSRGESISFVQTGERTDRNLLFYNRTGTLSFNGLNSAMAQTVNGISNCCEIGIIWFLQNGEKIVQGIEIDTTAAGNFVVDQRRSARAVSTLTSGDNDNPANILMTVESGGYAPSPFTTLTEAAIIAL